MASATGFDWTKFESNTWSPCEPGDVIEGVVTELSVKKGRSGDDVAVVSVDTGDGNERQIWASPANLRSQLASKRPAIGDQIRVRFVGTEGVGQPSPMKLFEVELTRGDGNEPF